MESTQRTSAWEYPKLCFYLQFFTRIFHPQGMNEFFQSAKKNTINEHLDNIIRNKKNIKSSMYLASLISHIHNCRFFQVQKFNYCHMIISNTQLLFHTYWYSVPVREVNPDALPALPWLRILLTASYNRELKFIVIPTGLLQNNNT